MKTLVSILVLFFYNYAYSKSIDYKKVVTGENSSWVIFAIYETPSGDIVNKYYNIDTLRIIGDIQGFEELTFFLKPKKINDNTSYHFLKSYNELDCKKYMVRPYGLAIFYDINSNKIGEFDTQDTDLTWTRFPIGTSYDDLHKKICH